MRAPRPQRRPLCPLERRSWTTAPGLSTTEDVPPGPEPISQGHIGRPGRPRQRRGTAPGTSGSWLVLGRHRGPPTRQQEPPLTPAAEESQSGGRPSSLYFFIFRENPPPSFSVEGFSSKHPWHITLIFNFFFFFLMKQTPFSSRPKRGPGVGFEVSQLPRALPRLPLQRTRSLFRTQPRERPQPHP